MSDQAPPPPPPPAGGSMGGDWQPGDPFTDDDKQWIMFSHFGPLLLGWLAPLIIMLTKGNESKAVRWNAVEALNFHLTMLIGYVVSGILICVLIGMFLLPIVWIISIVFSIIGGMAAMKQGWYRYPISIRMIK